MNNGRKKETADQRQYIILPYHNRPPTVFLTSAFENQKTPTRRVRLSPHWARRVALSRPPTRPMDSSDVSLAIRRARRNNAKSHPERNTRVFAEPGWAMLFKQRGRARSNELVVFFWRTSLSSGNSGEYTGYTDLLKHV